jgi:MEKHLA domain
MEYIWQNPAVIEQAQLIAQSLKHWTGRDLLPNAFPPDEFSEKLFHAPFVVVSHGVEPDPILNYGNQTALDLWEMTREELTRTPSRLTAEAPNREERARLLEAVTKRGFIDNYTGVRISRNGRRFHISNATVWNLIAEDGQPRGQAAMFSEWEFL